MDSLVGKKECVRSFLNRAFIKKCQPLKSMVDDAQGVDRGGNGKEMEKWMDG